MNDTNVLSGRCNCCLASIGERHAIFCDFATIFDTPGMATKGVEAFSKTTTTAAAASTPGGFVRNKHGHYFKSVAHLAQVDVYRVLELFGVTNPAIAHAAKKLLVAGGRGAGKSIDKDIQEAIDTLVRWQAMRNEDRNQDDLK